MRPIKLKIQAFGSYGALTEIDFTKTSQNLFLVTGDTGAGKTTIFDAIVFALYGEASSGTNRKNGVILQSQYVAKGELEPFVELTFAKDSSANASYTVRRVPNYQRFGVRGAAKGRLVDVSGGRSLTMPDGSVYPEKETDKKIEEIVGLTKEQFMQVGMIAQGEFMELLRASSKDKKEIFRKLFGTEVYDELVKKLDQRQKERKAELDRLGSEAAVEAGHIEILDIDVDDHDDEEALRVLRRKLANDRQMYVLGEFAEELERYCAMAGEEAARLKTSLEECQKAEIAAREAKTVADALEKQYQSLDLAEEELSALSEREGELFAKQTLLEELEKAFPVKDAKDRKDEAGKEAARLRKNIREEEGGLPALKTAVKKTAEDYAEAEAAAREANSQFASAVEKYRQAEALFKEIDTANARKRDAQSQLDRADHEEKSAAEQLSGLLEKVQELGEERERLRGAEGRREAAESLVREISQLLEEEKAIGAQETVCKEEERELTRLQLTCRTKVKKHEEINRIYLALWRAFVDGQAGILAKTLVEGEPCPVCGSVHHPAPCTEAAGVVIPSREEVERMRREEESLRKDAESFAGSAKALEERLRTHTEAKEEARKTLEGKLLEIRERHPELFVDQEANALSDLAQRAGAIRNQEATAQTRFVEIEKKLSEAEDERKRLQEKKEKAGIDAASAKESYKAAERQLEGLLAKREYESLAAAETAYATAKKDYDTAETARKGTEKAQKEAVRRESEAKARLESYREELPSRETTLSEMIAAYEQALSESGLTEARFAELVSIHNRGQIAVLREEIRAEREKKIQANAKKETAVHLIQGQPRPYLPTIEEKLRMAEENRRATEQKEKVFAAALGKNEDCLKSLQILSKSYESLSAEERRLRDLYNRLSGKISGSRMDLETYAQRYYLERILLAANRRFFEMTAGQFELRMVELEQAGDGRNKGLDLMVYSYVNGSEREIRSLSGGESFLAALALSLGMADQIHDNAAGVDLGMMFIDEGFGSLSEDALGNAVRVLKRMAGGDKLIGIISHVARLRQEIDDQLIVTKDEKGSHARWQLG